MQCDDYYRNLCLVDLKWDVTTSYDKCAFVGSQQRLLNICAERTVSQLYTNTDVPLHGFSIVQRSTPRLKTTTHCSR